MTSTFRRPSPSLAVGASLGTALGLLAVTAPGAMATTSSTHHHVSSIHHRVTTTYRQVNLVSDVPGRAQVTDPHLVNAWGASYLGTSPLWVSDNGPGLATLYSGAVHGSRQTVLPLVVTIPGGAPTGQVSNPTTSFVIRSGAASAPARFLFVGETGHLTGWAPTVGGTTTAPSTHAVDAAVTHGAVEKGVAMGQTSHGPRLFVANFSGARIDVFDGSFHRVRTFGAFKDTRMPRGYAPFNVMVEGTKVYVSYALQDRQRHDEVAGSGRGRVDVFSLDGRLLHRLTNHRVLNAPWGMTVAPSGFGTFSGDLLVGNFGDGRVNAFDPSSLAFKGGLRATNGKAVAIDGLWALLPGNGTEGSTHDVLFTAGPQDETHGLLGLLEAAHRR